MSPEEVAGSCMPEETYNSSPIINEDLMRSHMDSKVSCGQVL